MFRKAECESLDFSLWSRNELGHCLEYSKWFGPVSCVSVLGAVSRYVNFVSEVLLYDSSFCVGILK